jgi:uridine kinase
VAGSLAHTTSASLSRVIIAIIMAAIASAVSRGGRGGRGRDACRPLVIGIAGASCAGKSSLSQRIHTHFQCRGRILCQDNFATIPLRTYPNPAPQEGADSSDDRSKQEFVDVFGKPVNISEVNSWWNWEEAETIDVPVFVDTIERAVSEAQELGDTVFLVEGFVLLEG